MKWSVAQWAPGARQGCSRAPGGRALASGGLGKSPAQSACARAGGLRRCVRPFQIMASGGHALACASGAGQQGKICDSGDNSWPLGSNGTCTVALTERLDHMK